jgi:hypothetical protein
MALGASVTADEVLCRASAPTLPACTELENRLLGPVAGTGPNGPPSATPAAPAGVRRN